MKKLVAILTVFTLVFALTYLFPTKTNAQTSNPLQNQVQLQNQHVWVQSVTIDILSALSCQLAGVDPAGGGRQCLGYNPQTGQLGFYKGGNGAIGVMGDMIAMTFTKPPASSTEYLAQMSQKFGMQPAYAQQNGGLGFGFGSLNFLLNIWTVIRNVVYTLFVLIFVVIGFAIMLRIKIDPRTVMTIENQIPKLIVGLVLVTFSFAIAGLLIDLMWVGIYLIINLFASVPGSTLNVTQLTRDMSGTNAIAVANSSMGTGGLIGIVSTASQSISSIITTMFNTAGAGKIVSGLVGGIISGLLAGIPCSLLAPVLIPCIGIIGSSGGIAAGIIGGDAIGGIATILAFVIIFVAVLWALLKLWFELIRAYIYIILHTMISPFWVLLGLLPGSQINFEAWLREMISSLVAFPTTIAMFLFAKAILDNFSNPANANIENPFVPPLLGNPGNPSQIASLIGIGIILLTPQIVNILKEALKAPQFKYAAAIGQAVGVGSGAASRVTMAGIQTAVPYKNLAGTPVGIGTRFLRAVGFPGGGGGGGH